MMKQAQQLQRRMEQLQQELESATVEASAGGGVVTVVVTGKMTVESIVIDPEVVSHLKTWTYSRTWSPPP